MEKTLDEIVRFTPSTQNVTLLSVRLPSPRELTCAVWDGETAHIFGGMSAFVAMDDVLGLDPTGGGPAGMWESPILYVLLAVVIVSLATVVAWLRRERG